MASSFSSPSSETSDRLFRKLLSMEATICELISIQKQTKILKKKLIELDELILDIPVSLEDVANKWRFKVAGWWKQYATFPKDGHHKVLDKSTITENRNCKVFPNTKHQPKEFESGEIYLSPSASYASLKSNSGRFLNNSDQTQSYSVPIGTGRPSSQSMTHLDAFSYSKNSKRQIKLGELVKSSCVPRFGHKPSLPAFPDTNCFNALTGPVTKNSIRTQLKKVFDQLEKINEYDSLTKPAVYIDDMQKLLAAVVKSIKVFIPFLDDDPLFLEVSSYAFFKMSQEKQDQFNSLYDRKSLLNIMRFLRNQIVIFYENMTKKTKIEVVPMKSHDSSGGKSGNGEDYWTYCIYCRSDDHNVHECPIKRSMLCFMVCICQLYS